MRKAIFCLVGMLWGTTAFGQVPDPKLFDCTGVEVRSGAEWYVGVFSYGIQFAETPVDPGSEITYALIQDKTDGSDFFVASADSNRLGLWLEATEDEAYEGKLRRETPDENLDIALTCHRQPREAFRMNCTFPEGSLRMTLVADSILNMVINVDGEPTQNVNVEHSYLGSYRIYFNYENGSFSGYLDVARSHRGRWRGGFQIANGGVSTRYETTCYRL